MENEKNVAFAYPAEIYERAKAAKEKAQSYADSLATTNNPAMLTPYDFSALEKEVSELDPDVRIVIGLGRFVWKKTHWSFDPPTTRSVMQRMTNLDDPERTANFAKDYVELHIRYDELSTESRDGFRRHSVMHSVYAGSYLQEEENAN